MHNEQAAALDAVAMLREIHEQYKDDDSARGFISSKAAMAFVEEYERMASVNADLLEACKEFREAVLNERHQLAEGGFDSDQINAVLGLFDDTIGNAIEKAEGSHPSA